MWGGRDTARQKEGERDEKTRREERIDAWREAGELAVTEEQAGGCEQEGSQVCVEWLCPCGTTAFLGRRRRGNL